MVTFTIIRLRKGGGGNTTTPDQVGDLFAVRAESCPKLYSEFNINPAACITAFDTRAKAQQLANRLNQTMVPS